MVLGRLARSRLILVCGDAAILALAFLMAFVIRFGVDLPAYNLSGLKLTAPWILLSGVALLAAYDLYDQEARPWSEQYQLVATASLVHIVAVAAISFAVRGFSLPRTVFLIAFPIECCGLLLWRYALTRVTVWVAGTQRLLLVGAGHETQRLMAKLKGPRVQVDGVEPLTPTEVSMAIEQYKPDAIYVASDLPLDVRRETLALGLERGLRVYVLPELYDILLSHSRLVTVGDMPVLAVRPLRLSRWDRLLKRTLDMIVSCIAMVVALPLMGIIALLILVFDQPPVLYSQERVTEMGRTFTLYKFRTMRVDAETRTGPVLSSGESDPRVTPLGRFLRPSRLDELPQLFNVIRGDMTLVGPRPERPFFTEQFTRDLPEYRHRLALRAGLTGLAQVEGRYSTHVQDKVRFDLLYSRNYSIWTDVHILLKTISTVWARNKAS